MAAPTEQGVFKTMQDYSPPEGDNQTGKPSTSAGDIAAEAAAAAVRGQQQTAARPGETFQEGRPDEVAQRLESEYADRVEFEEQGEQTQPEGETQTQETQQPEGQQTQQQPTEFVPQVTLEDLEAHGIELPVAPDEVPDEFRPAYDQLAQAMIDSEMSRRDVVADAKKAMAQVEDFATRLNSPEGQQRMLLAMAMSENGMDTFQEVVEKVQRMRDDPEYAESVRRQLEAEVQLEAVRRRERVLNQQEIETRARQITSRTHRLAQSFGIDPQWAEQEVANQILRNEAQTGRRDITLDQVEEVVRTLASRVGARPQQQPRPKVQTPQTQQAQRTAPQTQAEGTGSTPSQDQPPQQTQRRDIPSNEHIMDGLRSAVRQANANAKNKGL